MRLAVVKLGGSLITDKCGHRVVREQVLERLAQELAAAVIGSRRRVLLGHGSGSFGHVAAREYGTHRGRGGAVGVSATQAAAAELHGVVMDALRAAGVPAYSVAPSSFLVTAAGKPVSVASEATGRALGRGLVAVTYGDIVMDRSQGHAICSTETALLALTRRLRRQGADVRRAYWLGDTDGIYDEDGATIPRLSTTEARRLGAEVGGSAGTDVTGGMRHRLDTALAFARLGVESWILEGSRAGVLQRALAGKHRGGTRITT